MIKRLMLLCMVCVLFGMVNSAVMAQPPDALDALTEALRQQSGTSNDVIDVLVSNKRTRLNEQLQVGAADITLHDLLLYEPFDADDAWVTFDTANGRLRLTDGGYRITLRNGAGQNTWGGGGVWHEHVVIQVDAAQLSDSTTNGYGLLCRANVNDDGTEAGYAFFIGSDGYFSINVIRGNIVSPLVDWRYGAGIQTGRNPNRITIVCAGDYLALYANGTLLGEAVDTTYNSGFVGLAATAFNSQSVDVVFDNLYVWGAAMSNEQ